MSRPPKNKVRIGNLVTLDADDYDAAIVIGITKKNRDQNYVDVKTFSKNKRMTDYLEYGKSDKKGERYLKSEVLLCAISAFANSILGSDAAFNAEFSGKEEKLLREICDLMKSKKATYVEKKTKENG